MSDPDQVIQSLINHCLTLAKVLLNEGNEFYPFAAYLDISKKLIPVGVYTGEEFPQSNDLIERFQKFLEQKRKNKELACYAITYDVRVTNTEYPDSIDAIAINLFTSDEVNSGTYYFPYKLLKNQPEVLEGWAELKASGGRY